MTALIHVKETEERKQGLGHTQNIVFFIEAPLFPKGYEQVYNNDPPVHHSRASVNFRGFEIWDGTNNRDGQQSPSKAQQA